MANFNITGAAPVTPETLASKNLLAFDNSQVYKLAIDEETVKVLFNSAGQKAANANNSEIFNDYANNTIKENNDYAHVEGQGTISVGSHSHVQGRYNKDDGKEYLHVVGNGSGSSKEERSNAYTLDKNGNAVYAGNITINGETSLKDIVETVNNIETTLKVTGPGRKASVYFDSSSPNSDIGEIGDIYCQIIS